VNKAEVRTALVDVFTLKGFPNPLPVYRVEQTFRTRVLENQYIVITDLKGFSAALETAPMSEVEKILDRLRDLVDRACRDFDGVSRMIAGDSYCLTFADPKLAIAAVERLVEEWHAPGRAEAARCSLGIGVHKGVLYAFRDFLHGLDLNIAWAVERERGRAAAGDIMAAVTGPVRRDLSGTEWHARLRRIDVEPGEPRLKGIEIYFLARRGFA
jgi:class 3 adenylate cyclase